MTSARLVQLTPSVSTSLLSALRKRAAGLSHAAAADDQSDQFPVAALQILGECGALHAVLPVADGGEGLGWLKGSAALLRDVLRALGGVHLSVARLFEGHVNAFQLLWTYGNADQRGALCLYVAGGGLLGVWNAPSPEGGMALSGPAGSLVLRGVKAYASGAGHIERPLITAMHAERGLLMVWPDAEYTVGPAAQWQMHGMRSSVSRSVYYDCPVREEQLVGVGDDYHQQPLFSGGAWRFLAAQLGAGEMLCELMRSTLNARQRADDPHQRTRMAECRVALESALLWVSRAAQDAEDATLPAGEIVARVAMARMAVERCLLDVLERVQRSAGLGAFARDCPIERMARDLSTYLRQPAPDALRDGIGRRGFEMAGSSLLGALYDSEL